MSDESAFKHLFGKSLLKRVGDSLSRVHPHFDQKRFSALFKELEPLEMKPRVQKIRDELKTQLPADFEKAVKIILKSSRDGTLSGFDLWPYSHFIQSYGLENLKSSLDAMTELTPLFSSEFAVRPYLIKHPKATLQHLMKCTKSKDENLRRWASEGSRPRLPWGERLHDFVKNPAPTLPILEALKFDEALYVRKSVSNHLNDIAKDHPELVIKILSKWKKEAGATHAKKIEWIIHRALRTLIKEGHPEALQLIGVSKAKIEISGLKLNQKKYKLGERIEFQFELQSLSPQPQKLVIDYLIHFKKSNQSNAAKVFKLKTVTLPAREKITVVKNHHLKKVTTWEYYSGLHFLEIQVNGVILKRGEFTLLDSSS